MQIELKYITDNDVVNGVFEVPEIVNRIADYSFHHCKAVKKVVIKNPKTYINPFAFNCCENLKEIVMPVELIKSNEGKRFMAQYKITELGKEKKLDDGRGGM